MLENVKPLSFENWLSLTQVNLDRSRYLRAHPALKAKLHKRYSDYLERWEREVDRVNQTNEGR